MDMVMAMVMVMATMMKRKKADTFAFSIGSMDELV